MGDVFREVGATRKLDQKIEHNIEHAIREKKFLVVGSKISIGEGVL